MDIIDQNRSIIEMILSEYAALPFSRGDLQQEVVFDHTHDRYLLVVSGWEGWKRIYNVTIHVDILDGKFWIQEDNTEEGVATELMSAGVPKDHIVLAFRPPSVRPHTEFAVA